MAPSSSIFIICVLVHMHMCFAVRVVVENAAAKNLTGGQKKARPGHVHASRKKTAHFKKVLGPTECSGHAWILDTETLDAGANGVIKRVRHESDLDFGSYVMKQALDDPIDEEQVNESDHMQQAFDEKNVNLLEAEINIMAQTKCPAIITVADAAPCEKTDKGLVPIPNAYIMPQMIPNLCSWYDEASLEQRTGCRDQIQLELASALSCLHANNFVHLDFKCDQVLYTKTKDGCPIGLKLSDFGSSSPEHAPLYKWMSDDHNNAFHLPSATFVGDHGDPLNIILSDEQYRADAKIDWCSFLWEMFDSFASGDPAGGYWFNKFPFPAKYAPLDCGCMGPDRKVHISWPRIFADFGTCVRD